MGTLLGLYEIVKFSKITKNSTDLHNNKQHPQRYFQGDVHTHTHTHTQIFSRYSGISSHSFGQFLVTCFEQSIPAWNRLSYPTYVGIQYWQKNRTH